MHGEHNWNKKRISEEWSREEKVRKKKNKERSLLLQADNNDQKQEKDELKTP